MARSLEDLIRNASLLELSNHDLLEKLKLSVQRERRVTLGVLLLLIEVERRQLHLDQYSSLFAYCTDRLRYSRSAAGRRIAAARCLRSHPDVLPMLLDGRLNLTTLCILARVLTVENVAELLARASGATQDEVESLAAEFGAPKRTRDRIKPVRSVHRDAGRATGSTDSGTSRKGDTSSTQGSASESCSDDSRARTDHSRCNTTEQAEPSTTNSTPRRRSEGEPSGSSTTDGHRDEGSHGEPTDPIRSSSGHAHSCRNGQDDSIGSNDRGRIDPSTAGPTCAFDVTFRVDSEFVEKLRRAQALLSSARPNPSLALVFDRALESFLEQHDPARREARRESRRKATRLRRTEALRRSTYLRGSTTEDRPSGLGNRRAVAGQASVNSGNRRAVARQGSVKSGQRRGRRRRSTPKWVRDQVFLRDGMRCSYVGPEGRCAVTYSLHLEHIRPHALGGNDDPSNLRTFCAAHNQRAADLVFGREFMRMRRAGTPAAGVKGNAGSVASTNTTDGKRTAGTPAPGVEDVVASLFACPV